jgi:hypothetical protein
VELAEGRGAAGVMVVDGLVYFDGLTKIEHRGQANLRFIMRN